MITRTTKTSLMAAAALLLALPAMAQPASPPAPPGGPAAEQHRPPPPPHRGPHGGPGMGLMRFFDQADTNLDGKVDQGELNSLVDRRFAAMDANKDGSVTLEEWDAYAQSQMPHRRGPEAGPRAERMKQMQATIFRVADANRDGKVTKDELAGVAGAMFRAADKNGDGVVTRDELPGMDRRGPPHHRPGGPGKPPAPAGQPG